LLDAGLLDAVIVLDACLLDAVIVVDAVVFDADVCGGDSRGGASFDAASDRDAAAKTSAGPVRSSVWTPSKATTITRGIGNK